MYFDDKSILEVEKKNIESTDDKQENIVFNFYRDGLDKVSFYLDKDYKNTEYNISNNISAVINRKKILIK